MSDVVGYIDNLLSGELVAVEDAVGRSWECVVEPGDDMPFFELVDIVEREDGDYDVRAHFMESDRIWTATFKGEDRLLFTKPLVRS